MINWSESYTCLWRVVRVDPETWADAETLAEVDGAKVTRTADGNMLEAGTLSLSDGGGFDRGYYRLVMVATDGSGNYERQDIATMLYEATGATYDHGTAEVKAEGRSVLHPANVRLLVDGTYAPANSDGAAWAGRLLESCISAPVSVEASFALASNIVPDFGTSALDAAWQVVSAGGCIIRVAGDGTVHIMPKPTEPALLLDSAHAGLVVPGIKGGIDMSDVPNRYIAAGELATAVAVNDDPLSPTSTVSRGYAYDMLDDSPELLGGETLERYARRRLEEESTVGVSATYKREWWPGVYPYDIVLGSLESVGLSGSMRVVSQSLECGNGVRVTEKAESEVRLWTS